MKSDFTVIEKIKKYLLGRLPDEIEVEKIEQQMLSDAAFLAEVNRVECDLIEDYLDQTLDHEEAESFAKYFLAAPQRKAKYRFMLALRESAAEYAAKKAAASKKPGAVYLNDFFTSRIFKVAVAGLLVAVLAGGFFWYFAANRKFDEGLAALKTAYQNQRPTEVRLSTMDYAPLINTRGGEAGPESGVDLLARDSAGLLLISAARENPSADTLRGAGLYYASLRDFNAALEQFDKGSSFSSPNSSGRVEFYADHGAVLLETAKSLPSQSAEKRLRYLENSLGKLDAALKLNNSYLPALFNRALCLQEMNSAAAAREAWQKYLEKDPASKWAKEARDHLKLLDQNETGAKKPAQVLDDFLGAFDRGDPQTAWKIAGESKEMVTGTMVSEQLTRGLLSADAQEAPNDAERMLSALIFLGRLEKENTGDNFFSDLADYYRRTGADERGKLSLAQSLTAEGYELCLKSKYAEALPKFTESRNLFAETGDQLEAAKTDYWISYCLGYSDTEKSLALANFLAGFARARSYKWLLEQALLQSGSVYINSSRFSPAIRSNQEALQIARETSDVYGRQKALAQLADNYTQLNEPAGALENSQNSLRETGAYFNSPRQTWRNYMFAARMSHRFGLGESAVAYAREAVYLSHEYLNEPAASHDSFLFLSSAYRTIHDYPESLKAAEESIRIGNEMNADPAQKKMLAYSLLQLGEAERALGNCGKAIGSYSQATDILNEQGADRTLKNYTAWKGRLLCYGELHEDEKIDQELPGALDLGETLRGQIEQEDIKTSFFSDEQSIYEFAAEHVLKKSETDLAFDYIEKGKARSLLDNLQPANLRPANLHPDVPEPRTANVLTLPEIRRQIPAGSQLVQYAVLPGKLLIWVVTEREVHYVEKNISSAELETQVRDFMNLITQPSTRLADRANRASDLSTALYSQLLQPIRGFLDKEKTVDIVPDKILCYLPFEALRSETGKYLVEDYRLSYAPSATLFVLLSQKAAARNSGGNSNENFLGVGNPAFDRVENPTLLDLPAAENEIRTAAAFYRGGQGGKQLIGGDAVKKNILAALPTADVFHFAGHFTTNELSPQFSKFLLAGNSPAGENSLTAAEIGSLKLNRTRLVVLSACKTALENYYHGEGAIGLSRTFFAAGVPMVVASRWKVDSKASGALMIAFHRNRKEKGLSIPAALRAAQLELLGNESFDSPFYWAAFAAIGGLEKA